MGFLLYYLNVLAIVLLLAAIFRKVVIIFFPRSERFFNMLCNTNNEEYINSFLSQQPIISYFEIERDQSNEEEVKRRYNFSYGSWELQPLNLSNNQNEIAIYLLKQKYVLNNDANEHFQNSVQELNQEIQNRRLNF